jgi:glycosyltransferase involved in cell wall biosynthesis
LNRKKLRIVIGGLGIGGAERHLSYILPELVRKNYCIRAITLSDQNDLVPLIKAAGVEVDVPPLRMFNCCPLFLSKIVRIMLSIFRLIKDYRRDPYAITHFFLPEAYILGMIAALIARPKGPLIMSRRSLNFYQQRRPGVGWVEKWLHRFTTFVLGNSQRVVQELQFKEGIPEAKLGLIYNGIDLSAFHNLKQQELVRQELGIKQEALVFVIIANLIPYKGHRDLLEAFALIQHQLPEEWYRC